MLAALSAVQTNLFDYNLRSELSEAAMGTNDYQYQYDPIGNRMRAVSSQNSEVSTNLYTANELNQYLSVTSALSVVNYSYDADGNLTNANGWTFTWDGENHLLTASNGTTVVHNTTYDFMSRRIRKENLEGETPSSRTFIYDGWNMIRESQISSFSTQVFSFVWGLDLSGTLQGAGGVGGLLSMSVVSGLQSAVCYPCYDANGNITDYVDTNGTLVAHYQYDPYGNITHAEGVKAAEMPFRFSTKYLDTETDLYYYGYRFYSPELGRWVSRDPITDEAFLSKFLSGACSTTMNYWRTRALQPVFLYVLNSPQNAVDALGLTQTPLTPTELTTCQNDINSALDILRKAIQNNARCRCFFSNTPRCQGNLINRLNNLQISIDNSGSSGPTEHGYTYTNDGQWHAWVTPYACRLGRWDLAATIIHELMHECDDNASGETGAFGAETACGF